MSDHAEKAIAALDAIVIDENEINAHFDLVQKQLATAKVHAALAQAEAIKSHTKVISAFMASTMTNTQAKTLVKALAGMPADAQ